MGIVFFTFLVLRHRMVFLSGVVHVSYDLSVMNAVDVPESDNGGSVIAQ